MFHLLGNFELATFRVQLAAPNQIAIRVQLAAPNQIRPYRGRKVSPARQL